jgi:APA family basic amino acid/polyamine antiporter
VLIVTSRISFAMARDGLLPTPLARLGTRTRAPTGALIASAALLALVAATQSVALVAAAGGFLYVCHFVVPLAALPVVRRRSTARPAFRTPLPWVVLPLAFGACALLLFSSGASGAAVGLGWMATGVIAHMVATRRRRA